MIANLKKSKRLSSARATSTNRPGVTVPLMWNGKDMTALFDWFAYWTTFTFMFPSIVASSALALLPSNTVWLESIATSKAASRQGCMTIPEGTGRLNRRRNSGQQLYIYECSVLVVTLFLHGARTNTRLRLPQPIIEAPMKLIKHVSSYDPQPFIRIMSEG